MIEAGGEGSVPDQTREGETQVIREKGEERRKEREEWRMGETFTLRPKMKIVLLDALRRGQRTRHIISALARCQRYEDRGQLFLSRWLSMRVINNRPSDSLADSSQRESFEDFDPPGSSGKHRTLGTVTRRFLIKFVRSARRLIIA